MIQKLLYFSTFLFLTGCVGAIVSGKTEYLEEAYPDIRNVPERPEATALRGLHAQEEKAARADDLKQLKKDWEDINVRNEVLRESTFSEQSEP